MLQDLSKRCSNCQKTFLIETHFQSCYKPETTKTCRECRDRVQKSKDKPTGAMQKRIKIYLSHKKTKSKKVAVVNGPMVAVIISPINLKLF